MASAEAATKATSEAATKKDVVTNAPTISANGTEALKAPTISSGTNNGGFQLLSTKGQEPQKVILPPPPATK